MTAHNPTPRTNPRARVSLSKRSKKYERHEMTYTRFSGESLCNKHLKNYVFFSVPEPGACTDKHYRRRSGSDKLIMIKQAAAFLTIFNPILCSNYRVRYHFSIYACTLIRIYYKVDFSEISRQLFICKLLPTKLFPIFALYIRNLFALDLSR